MVESFPGGDLCVVFVNAGSLILPHAAQFSFFDLGRADGRCLGHNERTAPKRFEALMRCPAGERDRRNSPTPMLLESSLSAEQGRSFASGSQRTGSARISSESGVRPIPVP